jgi:type I restriction enzyme S subunit
VAFLRLHSHRHSAPYFLQQILSMQGQRQIQDAMSGNAITRLTLEKINKLRFATPPTKAEQEAIANALSDADALIESLEQLITKKRQIKQGAMQELLTGKKRLPGYSRDWELKKIGEILSIQHGKSQYGFLIEMVVTQFWQPVGKLVLPTISYMINHLF